MLDWAATGLAAGGVFAALGVYDVLQRIAIRRSPEAHQWAVSGMARAINRATMLSGARFRVEGLEHVVRGQNYILVANHQSLLDISMASDFLEHLHPRYISKRENAQGIPGVAYNLIHGGSAIIDRKDPARAVEAIAALGRRIATDHWSVVIYPEGTRSRTGTPRPFREAGLKALVRAAPGVPVLPVTGWGGSKLFRHGLRPIVRNVEMGFKVHPAVTAPDPDDDAAFTAWVQGLRQLIIASLPPEDLAGSW